MRHRVVVLVAMALGGCGLVGSTQGYAGAFCNEHIGALFCTGFDGTGDAESPLPHTPGDASLLRVELSSAPAEIPWSPPNVLHVVSNAGVLNRFSTIVSLPTTGPLVCEVQFQVLQSSPNPTMIVWLEDDFLDGGQPMPTYIAGLMVGDRAGAGECKYTDAGPACHADVGSALDGGAVRATLTFNPPILSGGSVTVDIHDGTNKSTWTTAGPAATSVAVSVGGAKNADAGGVDVIIDNVFCQ